MFTCMTTSKHQFNHSNTITLANGQLGCVVRLCYKTPVSRNGCGHGWLLTFWLANLTISGQRTSVSGVGVAKR